MDPAATRALQRLRNPDDKALNALARLLVEDATETPLVSLAEPRWLAGQLATTLEAISHTDTVRDRIADLIETELTRWRQEEAPLGDWIPDEVDDPLRAALRRPWVPSEELVFRLLNHKVLQSLMREVLEGTVRRFRGRMSSIDKGLLGGLGGRAVRRGRGLLGGVAGEFVGAMKDEVELQVEGRLQEFLEGATTEGLRVVARHLSNPDHAESYAELRISTLDVLGETSVQDIAAEIEKFDVIDYVDIALAAVRAQLEDEDFVDRTASRIEAAIAEVGDGTFGAWLDEVHLRAVWTESTTDLLSARLAAVVQTEGFASWWEGLFVA